jgi:uncharacterized protein YecT (DUF1311 family)
VIVLLLAAAAVQAGLIPDCKKGPHATQAKLNECGHESYLRADRALNLQWGKTIAAARRLDRHTSGFEKPALDHLLLGQRAWLTYRLETCTWVRAGGGSIAPLNFWNCMTDMTKGRTEELKQLALDPNSGEPI